MANYIGTTSAEQQKMLQKIGLNQLEDLFKEIPEAVKVSHLNLPAGKSEREVRQAMSQLAHKNQVFPTVFRGAGAYRHYIPSVVQQIASKEEFMTAYTPYQPEISQGILQSIFEYQTLICELTGMEAANASVYDGATAAAEAVNMCTDKKRKKVLVAATMHPMTIATIETYYRYRDVEIELIPEVDNQLDIAALKEQLDATVACTIVQQPNYWGALENVEEIISLTHDNQSKAVLSVNPMTNALLKSPGELGADIAVGEAQPLGLPLNFGGAYIGFMATSNKMIRKLPGRIAGQTVDNQGRRAFVLTLQAREQHIRREKSNSNICSNVAHCALTVSIYLSTMGPNGLTKVAQQSYDKAHYFAAELAKIPGIKILSQNFFHEFVTEMPIDDEILLAELAKQNILGGLPTEKGLLWCATEMNTKAEIDLVVAAVDQMISEKV
ncbi:aminomethyl-transferring glycine dehydrogenase subunit GcvPA [Enterococcus sp. HY326]|uniref:aminomethyl-transferring glycine dehydrogenase subunit GcvPA n=1 Tax=Enterococcus sp. HY326 TaxID=2971265 RepID=UPI0022409144|nr:aminomethyl-transferring glycine dehydrogenase subunit GcvPA [Enterococcus sp. HY326]